MANSTFESTPGFPLKVLFGDGEGDVIEGRESPETEPEFHVPGQDGSRVSDARGRPVHLRIEACELWECRLLPSGRPATLGAGWDCP